MGTVSKNQDHTLYSVYLDIFDCILIYLLLSKFQFPGNTIYIISMTKLSVFKYIYVYHRFITLVENFYVFVICFYFVRNILNFVAICIAIELPLPSPPNCQCSNSDTPFGKCQAADMKQSLHPLSVATRLEINSH